MRKWYCWFSETQPYRGIPVLFLVATVSFLHGCGPEPTVRNSVGMDLVLISPGTFQMGNEEGDEDEKPVHAVTISKAFYMGKYEVTQGQWQDVMGTSVDSLRLSHVKDLPLNGIGPDYPMYFVSHDDAIAFINRLNEKEGTGAYRLPTEAEWEFASGADSQAGESLDEYAWYGNNAEGTTHPVGTKKPNSLGLYDMKGNVWEWCHDWLDRDYYRLGDVTDPTGGPPGERRMIRGGCWYNDAKFLTSSHRNYTSPGAGGPHLGFRIVREIP